MAREKLYRSNAEKQAAYRARQQWKGGGVVRWLEDLIAAGARFGTILADPPWAYRNRGTKGAATDHYHTMSLDALKAMPVAQLAARDCHLHVWATAPLLPEALTLVEAWGFTYTSKLVWDKEAMGTGNYWRLQTEDLLLGVRGHATHFRRRDLRNVVRVRRGSHSCKPDLILHMVEQASPGPYLELFGRRPTPGWTVFGDQVEHGLFES